jgi:hypothetical protein
MKQLSASIKFSALTKCDTDKMVGKVSPKQQGFNQKGMKIQRNNG